MQLPPPAVFHDKAKRTQQGNLLLIIIAELKYMQPLKSEYGKFGDRRSCERLIQHPVSEHIWPTERLPPHHKLHLSLFVLYSCLSQAIFPRMHVLHIEKKTAPCRQSWKKKCTWNIKYTQKFIEKIAQKQVTKQCKQHAKIAVLWALLILQCGQKPSYWIRAGAKLAMLAKVFEAYLMDQ